jgi:hypothetical protein
MGLPGCVPGRMGRHAASMADLVALMAFGQLPEASKSRSE